MEHEVTDFLRIKTIVQEIVRDSVPVVDFGGDRVMMITVNRTLKDYRVYDATRFSWKVSLKKASKVLFVLAVFQGIVIDVVIVDQEGWRVASVDNFPEFGSNDVDWLAFFGSRADESVLKRYCWQKIPDLYRSRGCRSQILYNYKV